MQVNFILNNLMSEVVLQDQIENKESTIPCDDCTSDDPAIVRCIVCRLYLCEICRKSHNRRKSTSNHKLVTFEELKSLGPSALSKSGFCKAHDGMHLKLYCESCEQTICTDCIVIQHRDHKYNFIKDVYPKEKDVVAQLLEETKLKQTLLQDTLKGVIQMSSCLKEARTAVTAKINVMVDYLIQIVENCRKTLLEQAGEIEREKLKTLEIHKEELQVALRSVNSSVEFTERLLRDGSQVEMLGLKKQMMNRLQELNTKALDLEPCADDVISYYPARPLNKPDVLNSLGRVLGLKIDPTKCKVRTDHEVDALKVWKEITISILVNDQHGKAVLEPIADVSVVIKSPNSQDKTQKLEVTNNGDGSYHGVYIPRIAGVYQVFVTCNGVDITGSPFQWCVKGIVDPSKTTLQMEAGKAGVIYNTLINQSRNFIIITRNSKEKQTKEDGTLINVEIREPNNFDSKVVPVQVCGDGRYMFCYKPVCVGNYQVSVKVDGNGIRGSPFTWVVEQWHLVSRSRKDNGSMFSQGNMTVVRIPRTMKRECAVYGAVVGSCGFNGGCHSWKVKVISCGKFAFSVGVTDCNVEPVLQELNAWFWDNGSKQHICNGKYTDQKPSNIPAFDQDDVIIVYLNDMTLTVHHLGSDKTDTFGLDNTTLYPYFMLPIENKLTLLV